MFFSTLIYFNYLMRKDQISVPIQSFPKVNEEKRLFFPIVPGPDMIKQTQSGIIYFEYCCATSNFSWKFLLDGKNITS